MEGVESLRGAIEDYFEAKFNILFKIIIFKKNIFNIIYIIFVLNIKYF
ncbi:hypothetical protein HMPREF9015_01343 [Leptotrichia wadei F0279]|uniref:Uncharacterized protein n=1 Tax=Leptotrichia wadei (strain F0279) TaxID=888055 RepID=U2RFN0_LEPWF|nr:hypothetical protein HMPREF9015_01343 [Leptotrichia wadei F0279]